MNEDKYFKIKSTELCIKNKTENKKDELYRFKHFLEQLNPSSLPNPSLKNTSKIVLVDVEGTLFEFFTKHQVSLQNNYLTGTGLFIKNGALIEEIEKYNIGEFYDGLSNVETDAIKNLIDEFQKIGGENFSFHQDIFNEKEKIKQKHLGKANMLISRYNNKR